MHDCCVDTDRARLTLWYWMLSNKLRGHVDRLASDLPPSDEIAHMLVSHLDDMPAKLVEVVIGELRLCPTVVVPGMGG